MFPEIAIAPTGRLHVELAPSDTEKPDRWNRHVTVALKESDAAGLFALAATRPRTDISPSFAFFRDVAGRCLAERCRHPGAEGEGLEALAVPGDEEMAQLVLGAPPMTGGEYLDAPLLAHY